MAITYLGRFQGLVGPVMKDRYVDSVLHCPVLLKLNICLVK